VLVVDSFEHLRYRRLGLHRGPVDPAQVPRLLVDLTLFRVDGTIAESDWQEADRGVLVVGKESAGPREVRIVWVGDPGPALGLRVDLWPKTDGGAEGEMVSTFLRAGETEGRIALPPAAGPLAYRYRVARFTAAGEEPVKDGTATGSLLVVQTGG
jgi:hypothetical protein